MKAIAQGKVAGFLLVIAGFTGWAGGMRLMPENSPWHDSCGDLVGAAAFFLVACFLPDLRDKRFLSRRSALSLMGLFLFLAAKDFLPSFFTTHQEIETWNVMLDLGIPLVVGIGGYWLSIFLIRGFRAAPEFNVPLGR
jgi:hypothetical protein